MEINQAQKEAIEKGRKPEKARKQECKQKRKQERKNEIMRK